MKNESEIIAAVTSDEIILFHSGTGKDSIVLLDMLSKRFSRVVCVFMYMVKGLSFVEKYIQYAERSYSNVEFIQVPHYALGSYIKYGTFGIAANPDQKLYSLSSLVESVRTRLNIEWVCFGFKQSDGLNRRLMLRTYEKEGINIKNKKIYPLSKWKNADCYYYISENNLIQPLKTSNRPSQDVDINDCEFLLWVKNNYPKDLVKIFNTFPESEFKLRAYEQNKEQ